MNSPQTPEGAASPDDQPTADLSEVGKDLGGLAVAETKYEIDIHQFDEVPGHFEM